MREIHPLGLVPYAIIMNALAYQVGRKLKKTVLAMVRVHFTYLVIDELVELVNCVYLRRTKRKISPKDYSVFVHHSSSSHIIQKQTISKNY